MCIDDSDEEPLPSFADSNMLHTTVSPSLSKPTSPSPISPNGKKTDEAEGRPQNQVGKERGGAGPGAEAEQRQDKKGRRWYEKNRSQHDAEYREHLMREVEEERRRRRDEARSERQRQDERETADLKRNVVDNPSGGGRRRSPKAHRDTWITNGARKGLGDGERPDGRRSRRGRGRGRGCAWKKRNFAERLNLSLPVRSPSQLLEIDSTHTHPRRSAAQLTAAYTTLFRVLLGAQPQVAILSPPHLLSRGPSSNSIVAKRLELNSKKSSKNPVTYIEWYGNEWASITSSDDLSCLAFSNIPWAICPFPQSPQEVTEAGVRAFLEQRCLIEPSNLSSASAKEKRVTLKWELLNWHPDKFSTRVLQRVLNPTDHEVINRAADVVQKALISIINEPDEPDGWHSRDVHVGSSEQVSRATRSVIKNEDDRERKRLRV
ncbi:hypothetical protein ACEPAH_9279 [Sanghuangporus vaninii]